MDIRTCLSLPSFNKYLSPDHFRGTLPCPPNLQKPSLAPSIPDCPKVLSDTCPSLIFVSLPQNSMSSSGYPVRITVNGIDGISDCRALSGDPQKAKNPHKGLVKWDTTMAGAILLQNLSLRSLTSRTTEYGENYENLPLLSTVTGTKLLQDLSSTYSTPMTTEDGERTEHDESIIEFFSSLRSDDLEPERDFFFGVSSL